MRILYIVTRGERAGAQVHVVDLMRYLSATNEIGVVTGEDGYLMENAKACNVRTFLIPDLVRSVLPHRDWRALQATRQILNEFRPDLVHAHTFKAGIVGRIAARLAHIPSLYTVHGWQFAPGTQLAHRYVALAGECIGARFGDTIITVCECDAELAERWPLSARNIICIHNGVEDCSARARPGLGKPITLVMVARFAQQKDHMLLLEAMQRLQGDVRLRLIGDGPTRPRVEAKACALGLGSRVAFCGVRPDVSQLLANAHIFVLASRYEGLPLSMLEAMRAGLPCVASDVGGVSDCLRNGENGLLVPPGDVSQLHGALQRLVDNADMRDQMGQAGRRRYAAYFTVDRMVSRTLEIYHQMIKHARSTEPVLAPKQKTHCARSDGD